MTQHVLTRRRFLAGTGLVMLGRGAVLAPSPAWAAVAKVGTAAPPFTSTSTSGKPVSLGDYRGQIVVLEWTNHECPYVRKHYESGNMQTLQGEATGQSVIWLSIISSAPGTQGHVSAGQADELTTTRKARPTAVLLDPTGAVGKMYGATNTPHMYVIDKTGMLAYAGAIDDKPTSRRSDVQGAKNCVLVALQGLPAGQPEKTPVTRAYGCTVKYA